MTAAAHGPATERPFPPGCPRRWQRAAGYWTKGIRKTGQVCEGERGMYDQVFINYKGRDSHSYAALLYVELSRCFGPEWVFLDCESIPAGADFVAQLRCRIRAARAVLAVIGPDWLAGTGSRWRQRSRDTTDWTRQELIEAFAAGVT